MARVVETEEPVVVRERDTVPQHVHDEPVRRSSSTPVVLIILLILILLALFWWRPWGGAGGAGGTTNVTVPTPSSGTH